MYAPGSPEREALVAEIDKLERKQHDLKAHIGGRRKAGGGAEIKVVQPHDHQHVLGVMKNSTQADAKAAVKAAQDAAPGWRDLDFDERCAILLKAADLLAGPWRQRINAATMLGQSKTAFQAEIDAACELIDFWRFNVHYAKQILTDQPIANSPGIWNRIDHRPLEGFVYAITPFNFTAIAGNLPTAPALMGNTVIWKPSPTQQLAASLTMQLLEEAGLPPGVINMLPGDGLDVSEVALCQPRPGRHPLHRLDRDVPAPVAHGRREHHVVPLLPAHRRRDRRQGLRRRAPQRRPRRHCGTALIRGAFEYQGQKCSAASRAYVAALGVERRCATRSWPRSTASPWVTSPNLSNFMGAVIDDRAFAKHKAAIDARQAQPEPARSWPAAQSTTRSATSCGRRSWSARDPTDQMFSTEYFGPILAVHVYEDARLREGRRADGVVRPVRPDRRDHRPGPRGDRVGRARSCASRPATSTSTTSRPARWSASSRSVAAAPAAPTTRPAPRLNLLRWTQPAHASRRPSCRRRTTATRTWAESRQARSPTTGLDHRRRGSITDDEARSPTSGKKTLTRPKLWTAKPRRLAVWRVSVVPVSPGGTGSRCSPRRRRRRTCRRPAR